MATKAHLEGNKRHQDKLYRVPVYIPKEQREPLKQIALEKGFINSKGEPSLNSYIKSLLSKDSGLEL